MPRRSRKPADLNRLAAAILDEATDEDRDPYEGKNPAAVSLHFMHYNFARPHKSLADPYPRTPAMAAGVADHVWSVEEIVALLG